MTITQSATPNINVIDAIRQKIQNYIEKKEELTLQNIVAVERRGKFIGIFTSILPPFRLTNCLKNYAEKKGILYKLLHPSNPYHRGRLFFFPNFRRYWGARLKDYKSGLSNKQSVKIRMRNIGYARALMLAIDSQLFRHESPNLESFYSEIIDQVRIMQINYINEYAKNHNLSAKIIRSLSEEKIKEIVQKQAKNDSYFQLLVSFLQDASKHNLNSARDKIKQKMVSLNQNHRQYYQHKRNFLNYLAKETVLSQYTRGINYSYRHILSSLKSPFSKKTLLEAVEKISSRRKINSEDIYIPVEKFSFEGTESISLSTIKRLSDWAMRMRLTQNEDYYSSYLIKGTCLSKGDMNGRLVGKDDEIIEDGWYQFVIMKKLKEGQPQLRYYKSAERRDGTPFLDQSPRKVNQDEFIYDKNGFQIQSQKSFHLNYGKFVAHSQLAGGNAVRSAGAFMIKNGKLTVIEDSSGHYALPETQDDSKFNALIIAKKTFEHFGADTTNTILERWKPYHGLDKLAKKSAATLLQPFFPSSLSTVTQIEAALAEGRPTEPGKSSPTQILYHSVK
jgi:hypothetical protein